MRDPLGDLLRRLILREAKVVVVGQGRVGLPLALRVAEQGFRVAGYTSPARALALRAGNPTLDDVPEDLLHAALDGRLYYPTADPLDLRFFDVAIITLPAGVTPAGELRPASPAAAAARRLAPLERGALVSLESPALPGTTERVLRPVLEQPHLRVGDDFFLGYSPALIEHVALESGAKVISGVNAESLAAMEAFYGTLVEHLIAVGSTAEAESHSMSETSPEAKEVLARLTELVARRARERAHVLASGTAGTPAPAVTDDEPAPGAPRLLLPDAAVTVDAPTRPEPVAAATTDPPTRPEPVAAATTDAPTRPEAPPAAPPGDDEIDERVFGGLLASVDGPSRVETAPERPLDERIFGGIGGPAPATASPAAGGGPLPSSTEPAIDLDVFRAIPPPHARARSRRRVWRTRRGRSAAAAAAAAVLLTCGGVAFAALRDKESAPPEADTAALPKVSADGRATPSSAKRNAAAPTSTKPKTASSARTTPTTAKVTPSTAPPTTAPSLLAPVDASVRARTDAYVKAYEAECRSLWSRAGGDGILWDPDNPESPPFKVQDCLDGLDDPDGALYETVAEAAEFGTYDADFAASALTLENRLKPTNGEPFELP